MVVVHDYVVATRIVSSASTIPAKASQGKRTCAEEEILQRSTRRDAGPAGIDCGILATRRSKRP